jgi:excinuclease ABC subunit A
MPEEKLIIRGAREHNLRDIDVELPRDRLTVITGLSGSGKSSLAFDTIYAEGQRRYVESLSAYARQFLGLMEKPDVDSIEGLSPAISIQQKSSGHNPRSTVGTVTEIYDYLRLLFARAGTPHCPQCGRPVQRQSAAQIGDTILSWKRDTRIQVLPPLVRGRKGEFRDLFESARRKGFVRALVDGSTVELSDPPALNRRQNHDVAVIVDRLVVRAEDRGRLVDSLETALKLAEGLVEVMRFEAGNDQFTTHLFSEKHACPVCGISIAELEPRHFSFNSPYGACPQCGGLGVSRQVSEELVVGDPSISLLEGVILPWGEPDGYLRRVILPAIAKEFGFSLNTPWGNLPQKVRDVLLFGAGGRGAPGSTADTQSSSKARWEGIIANVQRRYQETESDAIRLQIAEFMVEQPCSACNGSRLKPESLAVTVAGHNLGDIVAYQSMRRCGSCGASPSARREPPVWTPTSPAPFSRKSRSGSASWWTSGWITSLSTVRRSPCRGESRSASGSPPRLDPALWVFSISSTNLPSVCTSATTRNCWRHSRRSAIWGIR